jgi:hypothetical protein
MNIAPIINRKTDNLSIKLPKMINARPIAPYIYAFRKYDPDATL